MAFASISLVANILITYIPTKFRFCRDDEYERAELPTITHQNYYYLNSISDIKRHQFDPTGQKSNIIDLLNI